jgi:uncharacterized protein
MNRHLFWTPLDTPGLEHLHLWEEDEEIIADSVLLGLDEQRPFRLAYTVRCDSEWRVTGVDIVRLDDETMLSLLADGLGHWSDERGNPLPEFNGCIDIDLSATPFTNTLPIRRLRLNPGKSAEFPLVFIEAPHLSIKVGTQRYTCLEPGLYEFKYPEIDFTAVLPVDADGLVLDYPGLFRRVWTG